MAFDDKVRRPAVKLTEAFLAALRADKVDTETQKIVEANLRYALERNRVPVDDFDKGTEGRERSRPKWDASLAAVERRYPNDAWKSETSLSITNKIAGDFPKGSAPHVSTVHRALGRDPRYPFKKR
jgi:hypothetical protein